MIQWCRLDAVSSKRSLPVLLSAVENESYYTNSPSLSPMTVIRNHLHTCACAAYGSYIGNTTVKERYEQHFCMLPRYWIILTTKVVKLLWYRTPTGSLVWLQLTNQKTITMFSGSPPSQSTHGSGRTYT